MSLSSLRRKLRATGHLRPGHVIYGLPALIVLGRLALFAVSEPYYEADTALLVNKLIETVRGCLKNLHTECTHAGPLPLFQYVPTLLLKYLGWPDSSILHFFAYSSFLAFVASVFLIFWTLKKRAPVHLGVAGALVIMSGPLLWYSHSTFAEMCAAFLTLAFACACLLRLSGWLTILLMVLAGTTKETALPFLLLIGLVCLLPEIVNDFNAVKRRVFHLALGAVLSAASTALFNYFRFRTFYNRDYLTDILIVPSWRIQLDFFLGIWFSPNGGLAFFWPSFVFLYFALAALLVFQGLRRERHTQDERSGRERLIFYLPLLIVSASLFALTLGFSRWYAPFGWVAWGPRLLLPWIPAMLLLLFSFYAAQFEALLRALLGGTYRFAFTCAAFVLASVPQFAILFRHQVLGGIFGPSPDCPRSPIIQESVAYYYHCMHTYIWPRRFVFPELFSVALRGAGSRSAIFYILMLVLGCVWIRRRLTGSQATTTMTGAPWLNTLREAIEPLWVSGLALLCLFIGSLFNLEGETFDWTEYLLLATIFPALLIALSLADRFRPALAETLSTVRFSLAAFLILLPVFALRYKIKYVLIISLVQWIVTSRLAVRSKGAQATESVDLKTKALRAFPLLFVIVMSWVAATRYIWWVGYEEFILGSNLAFIIFILSLFVVLLNLYDQEPALAQDERRDTLRLIGNIVAVLLIAMVSVRTDHIFGLGEIHHWSFFTGPAQMVRQGGWLLWDVPSQYGFLVTLTLAWLPTKTAWQSLFLVNALFNFLIALMLFYLFRALRPGLTNLCFALAMTLAAVFFRSGLAPFFEGPSHLPNIGGLRFFWAFALVAILFREYRVGSSARSHTLLLWAGCVVWLVGTLWSAESAVYCSAIWLPSFALLAWRETAKMESAGMSLKTRLRATARRLLLPPALLLSVVLLITAFYFLRLGHGPDWYSFIEYAQAYRGGFATIPIDLNGGVWVLVIVFCAFMTVAVYFMREDTESAALPLIIGAAGGLWATSSYFVSRSHPNNVHNLGAIFCGAMGLALYLLLSRERRDEWWAMLVKASLVPLLTIVLVSVFANKGAVTELLFAQQASYVQIERLIPISDPGLDNLLNSAEIKPDAPLVYVGPNEVLILSAWTFVQGDQREVLTTYKSWLPVPVYSLGPLPEERRKVYMSRFASRIGAGGWLIEHKRPEPLFPWFSEYLKLHYTPGRTFENDAWRLTWYDYKG
ncbi:MAG TPA: hypothetical protein VF553_11215 [Pyrinomonadaceae bacterium]